MDGQGRQGNRHVGETTTAPQPAHSRLDDNGNPWQAQNTSSQYLAISREGAARGGDRVKSGASLCWTPSLGNPKHNRSGPKDNHFQRRRKGASKSQLWRLLILKTSRA